MIGRVGAQNRTASADHLAQIHWGQTQKMAAMSLSDQIANEIAARIVTGRCAPGERLLEQQISAEFEVSRNPVREALRILERDGFVDILPRRGAQVVNPDDAEIVEIFEILTKLFELIGRRLAAQKSAAGQQVLSDSIAALTEFLAEGSSPERHLLTVNSLSMRMAELSGNRSLMQIVSRLMIRCIGYIRTSLHSDERRRQSIANWERLLAAIEVGDVAAAEVAGRSMVQDTFSAATKARAEERPERRAGNAP